MDAFHTHTGIGVPLRVQCRHRPDHPCGLPEAGCRNRFRGRPVRWMAVRPRHSSSTSARSTKARFWLLAPTLGPDRHASMPSGH